MKKNFLIAVCLSVLAATACQQPATTVTTNTTANANTAATGTNSAATNANASTASAVTIETREPEQYQATVTLKLDTTDAQGQNTLNIPPLSAQVARSGANKRMEFSLPNNEKVVYLDLADKRFLVLPNRKQYAEVNREALGFDVRDMMTPGQLVQRAQSYKGVERVGEEQFNGRTAVRYRYGAVTDTKSQAGQVQTESFVLVDKDTGLPLRSETAAESTSSANVQGTQVKGVRLVTEMSNIQTNAPAELFAEPTDFAKIPPEQVRSQVTQLAQVAGALLGNLMQRTAQPGASPANSPASTPTENVPRP